MVPLLLAVALLPQSPLAAEAIQPDRGPGVLLHRQTGPLVALRLSTPAMPLPEGGAALLQELARPEAEATARLHGARLEMRDDGGRSIIEVVGPASAFDALAALVRRAVDDPDVSVGSLRRARARAEDRVLARLEQPGPRVRRLLRSRLAGVPDPRGAAATRLAPESVRRLRARLYAPGGLQVVVVGDIPAARVRSAFAGWPAGDPGMEEEIAVGDAATAARPEAHREWGGLAFVAGGDPAVLAVAAALVEGRVDRSALRYGAVEAWQEPLPALVLLGAVTPDDSAEVAAAGSAAVPGFGAAARASPVQRYLRRMVAEAVALTSEAAVAAARGQVRDRLLLEARTASGKAEVIGRLADAGVAGGAEGLIQRLDRVQMAEVRVLLTGLLETPPVLAGAGR